MPACLLKPKKVPKLGHKVFVSLFLLGGFLGCKSQSALKQRLNTPPSPEARPSLVSPYNPNKMTIETFFFRQNNHSFERIDLQADQSVEIVKIETALPQEWPKEKQSKIQSLGGILAYQKGLDFLFYSEKTLLPKACYRFLMDRETQLFIMTQSYEFIEDFADQLSFSLNVAAAGELCLNEQGKIYYFNNKSLYAISIPSQAELSQQLQIKFDDQLSLARYEMSAFSDDLALLARRERITKFHDDMAIRARRAPLPEARLKTFNAWTSSKSTQSSPKAATLSFSHPRSLNLSQNLETSQAVMLIAFRRELNLGNIILNFQPKTISLPLGATLKIKILGEGNEGSVYGLQFFKDKDLVLECAVKRTGSLNDRIASPTKIDDESSYSSDESYASSNFEADPVPFEGEHFLKLDRTGVQNPNLVKYFAHVDNEFSNEKLLFMEALPVGTLRNYKFTLEHYIQAAEGLQKIHKLGFIHNDIKADNMGLGADGKVRITDLGMASPNTPGRIVKAGTANRLAPEKFDHQKYLKKNAEGLWMYKGGNDLYDPTKGDVYSLAYDLYKKKLNLQTDSEWFRELDYLKRNPSDDLLKGLLKKALDPDPSKRISLDKFIADLKQIKN